MAMKETVFSIRAYFSVIGALGLIRGVSGILVSLEDQAIILPATISLLLGCGFLYSSVRFPKLLKTSTRFVEILLYVTGGISALNAVFVLASGMYGADLIVPFLMVMVAWYLLMNVKRLKEEHGVG